MLELATNQLSKLFAIENLFEALHANEVLYCNLKSNDQHLITSLTGESDVDVLFDEKQKVQIELLLNQLGFKKFNAIQQKQYKHIVDFIGLDGQSGKIIHLHTHYRLALGKPYLKEEYQLELEQKILQTRVYNEKFGVYCIQPAFELALLYLSEVLKLRNRDLLLTYLKKRTSFSEKTMYEYNSLTAKTSNVEVEAVLKPLFNNHSTLRNLVNCHFSRRELYKLAPAIRRELSTYKLYPSSAALVLRWYRETTVSVVRKLSYVLKLPILARRMNPRGGTVIAITGAQDSTARTITHLLKQAFEKKLDVYKIKLGRSDRSISAEPKISASSDEISNGNEESESEKREANALLTDYGFTSSFYQCVKRLALAFRNYKNLKLLQIARRKGALVICDGYLQNQFMNYDDTPLFYKNFNNRNHLYKMLAKVESNVSMQAADNPPDILFHLVTGAEIFQQGSAEKTNSTFISEGRLANGCKIIMVDAKKTLDDVLSLIKKEIWSVL